MNLNQIKLESLPDKEIANILNGYTENQVITFFELATTNKTRKYGTVLGFAPKLQRNREVVMAAVRQDFRALGYADNKLKNDIAFMTVIVAMDAHALQYASERTKDNRDVVMAAIQNDCRALQFASESMKGDKEIVTTVMKKDYHALEWALLKDKDIMLSLVAIEVYALYYASDKLKNDKDVVLAAVAHDGRALMYASHALRNDKEVVLAAVAQNGRALQYASHALKNNRDVVLAALSRNGLVIGHYPSYWKIDVFTETAVRQNGLALQYFKPPTKVVMAAVEQNGMALQFADDFSDRGVVMAAVKQNGMALQFASEALKNDKDVAMAAVQTYGLALEWASVTLKSDDEVVLLAVRQDSESLLFAAKKNDRDFVKKVMQVNGDALQFSNFTNDKEIVLLAVRQSGLALQYAPALQKDKDVVTAAVAQDGRALKFLHIENLIGNLRHMVKEVTVLNLVKTLPKALYVVLKNNLTTIQRKYKNVLTRFATSNEFEQVKQVILKRIGVPGVGMHGTKYPPLSVWMDHIKRGRLQIRLHTSKKQKKLRLF